MISQFSCLLCDRAVPNEGSRQRAEDGNNRSHSPRLSVSSTDTTYRSASRGLGNEHSPVITTTNLMFADNKTSERPNIVLPAQQNSLSKQRLNSSSHQQTYSPPISPDELRSHSSFDGEAPLRSIPLRPMSQQLALNVPSYGSSPSRSDANPLSSRNATPISSNGFESSPRPESVRLAPDPYGNHIPSDAKWTRIKRSLVSPEVLDQDGRRYEARPDFVAILGVLSRQEIEEYAARSQAIRDARRARRNTYDSPQQSHSPDPRRSRRHIGRHSLSSSEDERGSPADERPRRPRYKDHRSSPAMIPTQHINVPYYSPQAPPTPMWSPIPNHPPQAPGWSSPHPSFQGPNSFQPPPLQAMPQIQQPYYAPDPSLTQFDYSRRSKLSSNVRDGNKEANRKRWRENLTAAGIGGAAVSLLSVLSEAAEGF